MASSVVRSLRIMRLLAESTSPMSLSEIAAVENIPKATAHGILQDLLSEGFVERDSLRYQIGLRAFEVGTARLRRGDVTDAVGPELAALTRELDVTAHFAVLDGPDVVYVCKEDPPGRGVRLASQVGARLPAHLTAVGRACLAHAPQEAVDRMNLSDHGWRDGPMSPEELEGLLIGVRESGFAVDEGEAAAGIKCIAAPIVDGALCRGAIGVSYPKGAVRSEERAVQAVKEAASLALRKLATI